MNNEIDNLLVLQERDKTLVEIESQIASAPRVREAMKAETSALRAEFAMREKIVKEMELERANLRSQRLSNEEKISKFKTQQSIVKKNEEYQALIRAIESAEAEVSKSEEVELELLYKIDEVAANLEKERAQLNLSIEKINSELERFEANLKKLDSNIESARHAVRDAEMKVGSAFLDAYNFMKKNSSRRPIVVIVKDEKCMGCHLKISGSTSGELKSDDNPVTCENCGRIIYKD